MEPDFRPAKKAHIALATLSLNRMRDQLEAAGLSVHPDSPLESRERFYSEDPFGNRLEFIDRSAA